MPRRFLVPTATVTPEPACLGIRTDVTVLKALTPLIVAGVPMTTTKDSVITLPSILTPVTTTEQVLTLVAVPPTVTDRARGTSGFVIPEVTVVSALDEAEVAASTAVLVPAATFLRVSV